MSGPVASSASGMPASFALLAWSTSRLLSVRGLPALVHLDRVYLNGLNTLLPFWITNETDHALEVTLAASPAHTLKFQRHNANWDAVPAADREAYVEVLPPPAASPPSSQMGEVTLRCDPELQRDFCEVFNQVDGESSVKLSPHQTVEMVLLFVARAPRQSAHTPAPSRRPSPGQPQLDTAASADYFAVDRPFTSDLPAPSAPDAADEDNVAGSGPANSIHYGFASALSDISFHVSSPSLQATDSYTARLRTSFCRSVLEMDPPSSRIYLDDCTVGKLYERVLRVRNASEIGLDWTMTVVETTDSTSLFSLLLLDCDMHPLTNAGHLACRESTQICVRYTPRAAGEFLCRFLVENSNDPSNQRYWVFRARASQRQKPRRIELIGDPDINFGNCTSGVWYNREVTFKNVSDAPVVMRFRVEGNTNNLSLKSAVKSKQSPLLGYVESPSDVIYASIQELSMQPISREAVKRQASPHNDEARIATATTAGLELTAAPLPDPALRPLAIRDTCHLPQLEDAREIASESVSASIGFGDIAAAAGSSHATSEMDTGGLPDHLSVMSSRAESHSTTSSTCREPNAQAQQEHKAASRRAQPRDRLAASHGSQPALFDEVLIKPGSTRTVVLSLTGNAPSNTLISAGQFDTQSFTLFCECSATIGTKQTPSLPSPSPSSHSSGVALTGDRNIERFSLPCTLRMCTSYVRVTPTLLDFGIVDVGMLKTMHLQIENTSHVEAIVQCKLESKVINCIRTPIVIPPMQSASVRVDIYPRRINPRYRKQIIVRNRYNRFNDNVVEVRSVHVDQRRMAFHNLFYKTLVLDNEQNFVDFGAIPLNSRAVRLIGLRNICRCPITIDISVNDSNNSNSSFSAIGAAQAADTSSDMVVVYRIVPLTKNGALTAEARLVAHQLPLLERHAVMHSSIERFKEHSGGSLLKTSHAPTTMTASLAECAIAQPDRTGSSRPANMLPPDMFVDKTVERGHVCLAPFLSHSRAAGVPRSVDYLDVAPIAKRRTNTVRIQESCLWGSAALKQSISRQSKASGATELHSLQSASDASASGLCLRSLDPADSAASSMETHLPEDAASLGVLGRARQLLDEIVNHLDQVPQVLFSSPQAEDEYVRRQVDLRNYIDLLIESGFLRPARRVVLAASADEPLVIMVRPVEASDAVDKAASPRFDANLYFRLVNRPGDLLSFTDSEESAIFANSYQLPVRRFLIQAAPCRTELEIGQKSINVGNMQVDESSRKYLVIKNHADTPLMYAIRKTGSIASGDIQFVDNNRYGVVRGFDSRKIVFVFNPSLTGAYSEQISIANVLDLQGGKTATLKAVVRRPSKFYIQSLLLEFGEHSVSEDVAAATQDGNTTGETPALPLKIGQRSSEAKLLVIKNMTAKTRHFVVKSITDMRAELLPTPLSQLSQTQREQSSIHGHGLAKGALGAPMVTVPDCEDDAAPQAGVTLDPLFPANVVQPVFAARVIDHETEEKIEALEQKLKIAARKNRPEKVEKYTSKLSKLRGVSGAPKTGAPTFSPKDTAEPTVRSALQTPPTYTSQTMAPDSVTGENSTATSSLPGTQPAAVIRRLEADSQLFVTLPGNTDVSIPVVAVARVTNSAALSQLGKNERRLVCARGQFVVYEDKDKDNVKIVTLQAPVSLDIS